MPQPAVRMDATTNRTEVHLLDVGQTRYGDCILCIFGELTILIDGAHPGDYAGKQGHTSIPDQLAKILDQPADSLVLDLLFITHTHSDHFGCLPRLVSGGQLSARYAIVADADMGWGRNGANADAHPDALVRVALESLRDDQGFTGSNSVDSMQFVADAPNQEDSYRQMIDKLRQTGKAVTYLGRDPDTGKFDPDLQSILAHFAGAGLTIDLLGPSGVQLAKCAQEIASTLGAAAGAAEDMIHSNPAADAPTIMAALSSDALADAAGRAGNYVNLQSLVTLFTYNDQKFLFSGDMQLQDQRATQSAPQVSSVITTEVAALRKAIRDNGPYDFVKIGHHGSYNAFSEEILTDYGEGTLLFGITTGEVSPTHPDPKVTIPILIENKNRIQWGRTDYNRHCTFNFGGPRVTYQLETGQINNINLNKADLGKPDERPAIAPATRLDPPAQPAAQPVVAASAITAASPGTAGSSITFQVPLNVTISVSLGDAVTSGNAKVGAPLQPSQGACPAGSGKPDAAASVPPKPTSLPPLSVGAGRDFTKLLFVTSRDALANNIGKDEANHALAAIRQCGAKVLDTLPLGLTTPEQSIAAVQAQLRSDASILGVVLVGGHDVVPHQIFDCLPPDLRALVGDASDLDRYIVWSDAAYGRRAENSIQDLPVSRIPDGHLSAVLFAALGAGKGKFSKPWSGLRNKLRPFADTIFSQVSKTPLLTSAEVLSSNFPPLAGAKFDLHSDNVYLMLHGHYISSDLFWGEVRPTVFTNAFSITNVPSMPGQIVLTGCCWGALTTTLRACDALPGQPVGSKQPATSIALRYLSNGAQAFIGCTGTHYSPPPNQPVSAGGAMHDGFFRYLGSVRDGGRVVGPAEALFLAKLDYVKNMPHGVKDQLSVAAEYKVLHEYLCLGIGW